MLQGDEGEESEEEVVHIPCDEDPDCDPHIQAYIYFMAFDQGFTGEQYANNFTNCALKSLNWVYNEIATYKVKLHYADYSDMITNTTLFLQNTTTVFHICTDVTENLYYYSLF